MADLRKIVYLTEAQKDELFTQGTVTSNGKTVTYNANDLYITPDESVSVSKQHEAVFYGLAKAAGDTTQALSDNAVGTYTSAAKAAIQTMLGVDGSSGSGGSGGGGAVSDVQINGTSILSSGVANIPLAASGVAGAVKINTSNGVGIYTGELCITKASSDQTKGGTNQYKSIVPYNQHEAAFYGLAKAAGDSTQASSSNTVGTYTTSAKAAIQTMLGISGGAEAIETITSTTPSITAAPNVRYMCGTLSTLSITPCELGTCDVIFTSGTTATVLTVPNTVKWPAWFDPTSLNTSTIYEIIITDEIYGMVMRWNA